VIHPPRHPLGLAADVREGNRRPDVTSISARPSRTAYFVDLVKSFHIPILAIGHLLIFCGVYWLALMVRFESFFPHEKPFYFWLGMPLVATVKLCVFYLMRNFHGWWRYVTFADLVALGRASIVSMLTLIVLDYFLLAGFQLPRSVIVIDCALTIAVLSALRSSWRIWDEQISSWLTGEEKRRPALLVGDDPEAAKLAHMINSWPNLGMKIVGLVSPGSEVAKKRYGHFPVIGTCDNIGELSRHYRADSVYVSSGRLMGKQLCDLIAAGRSAGFDINVVPKLDAQLRGGSKIPLRPVQFEDLLRRPAAKLDTAAIRRLVEGKVILITGAGGSIGSEICRQLLKFEPEKLILAGRGENRLFHLLRELIPTAQSTDLEPVLVNITDRHRVEGVFKNHCPDVVFHAAAHKHVPLVELNPGEAVINNIEGTRIVADAAHRNHVNEFVLISTDKAVNPTSLMGCTKQIAERYCLALGHISETKFVVTRFGNVLGSEGSVVPLFQEQIKNGGPITITDPKMTRYFMTIPEASQLVLQAAAMGDGGEIFVLDMGQPVKILDLAKDLIRLAGLEPDSIEIEFTGIRPGEKLYEELYYGEEAPLPTTHSQIQIANCRDFDFEIVNQDIEYLVSIAFGSTDRIRAKILEIVPEYRPAIKIGRRHISVG
jgi:FlaA1/EpsC-like NDP-sugar epimerase